MAKSSELTNITKRNMRGETEIGISEGFNLFSVLGDEKSTAFTFRLEEESETKIKAKYIKAFFFGLKKLLSTEEYTKILQRLRPDEEDVEKNDLQYDAAVRLLKSREKFERIREYYPWQGGKDFNKLFFANLLYYIQSVDKIRNQVRAWKLSHKEEVRAYNERYRKANPEKIKEKHKTYGIRHRETLKYKNTVYYLAHKEEISNKKKEYYETNKAEICKRVREYQEKNHEKVLHDLKAYRLTHKDEIKEYNRKYKETHRDELNAKKREKRAREKAERQAAALAAVSEGMTLQNAVQPISYT